MSDSFIRNWVDSVRVVSQFHAEYPKRRGELAIARVRHFLKTSLTLAYLAFVASRPLLWIGLPLHIGMTEFVETFKNFLIKTYA